MNVIGDGTISRASTIVNGVYQIKTPMDLQWLAYLSANNSMPSNIVLENDITMPSNVEFQPIEEGEGIIFDGNQHTISGLHINENSGCLGLFTWLGQSTVKDLTLDNCDYVTNTGYIGGVVGQSDRSTFENLTVNGTIKADGASYGVGGIAASVYNQADGKTMFIDCTNNAAIGGAAAYNVGSMFGTSSGSPGEILIYNSKNTGAITAKGSVGYVFGFGYMNTSGTLEIISFANSGDVNGGNGSVSNAPGGGYTYSTASIDSKQYIAVEKSDGTWVAVSKSNTAYIDGTGYGTIDEAIKQAAEGDTITLLQNVTDTLTLPADKALTIDLNGYSVSGVELQGDSGLTLVDSKSSDGANITASMKSVISSGYDVYKKEGSYIVLKDGSAAPDHSSGMNTWSKDSNGVYVESYVAPYVPSTSTSQKPDVTASEGVTTALSSDGTKVTPSPSRTVMS